MSGFGLYVHWPFCAAKCPYCDFNSYVRARIDQDDWCKAIMREMAHVAELQGNARPRLDTIYFGGGSPSLLSARIVGRVIAGAARLWRPAADIEITLEANPASSEAARFADYAKAGVNRLSLGVQALNDADLKFLGRLHGLREAKAALALTMRTFPRVSLDLIYGRPNQSGAAWRAELGEALAFGTEHLSLYQLTIEPETPFATMAKRGILHMPGEEESAALFEITQEMTERAGVPAYEVANHARLGCECRHNLIYWRYGTYAGVGPGAHGRLEIGGKRFATVCERPPERWLAKVRESGHGLLEMREIDSPEGAREHLLMNMRLREGLELEAYRARWGVAPSPERLAALAAHGLVECKAGRLAATKHGMLVLDRVIAELCD